MSFKGLNKRVLKEIKKRGFLSLKDFIEKFLFMENNEVSRSCALKILMNEPEVKIHGETIFWVENIRPKKKIQEAELAFVDVETSGRSFRIIELGVILSKGKKIEKTEAFLFNPKTSIDPFVINLTKIDLGDIQNSPTFKEKSEEIKNDLKNKILIGHNVEFDVKMLKKEFEILSDSLDLDFKPLCTLKLSKMVLKKRINSFSLDSLSSFFDISYEFRHRALHDALITYNLFFKLLDFIKKNDLKDEKLENYFAESGIELC